MLRPKEDDASCPKPRRRDQSGSARAIVPQSANDSLATHSTDPRWKTRLFVNDKGKVLPNLINVAFAFRNAPELCGAIALDQMSGNIMVRRPLPAIGAARCADRAIDDADAIGLTEWLQGNELVGVQIKTVQEAITMISRENSFHPVRAYFNRLQWDGVPRVDGWLTNYLGAANSAYTKAVGRFWLISGVARIERPGCQVDHMLVLEGPQGLRKSTASKILGGEWFTDHLPDDLRGKDSSVAMKGSWIIEIAEMHAMTKSESGSLKAFITRTTERYRPPYSRYIVEEPRQSIMIGTINPTSGGYLRDATGARRFWPVKVTDISIDDLRRDRDQLWAEAVALFRSHGAKWWPDAEFERRHILPVQSDRYAFDAWEDKAADFLESRHSTTILDFACAVLNMEAAKVGRTEQNRIVDILTNYGWVSGPKDTKTRRRLFTNPKMAKGREVGHPLPSKLSV
ncbi:virulence-associated E family protein [Mesorhizobium sp.]|uniref:virulence-associated E family protein n=1 Tax=Mesorhizobium sp. TaxID=1871066 RepID=UPI000FE535D7|nr:virulence-associated E family protein [Mesorhizobium sp.]RWE72693.1 MAG: virulence-associated E family protein [Mesorhizobium sp.]